MPDRFPILKVLDALHYEASKGNDGDPDRGARSISGFIGLQNHPQGKTVYFKEISVHPIKK
jgi:hypothetical protein